MQATEIEKKWVPLQQFLLFATKQKGKKNLILATTYESHDNSNLMKYKNTATIIVK